MMRIEGRTAVNSAASVAYDSHNLPSGEVFTAPYATEGKVTFDVPMTIRGTPSGTSASSSPRVRSSITTPSRVGT